jgi:glutamate-5-semialdehyde dehydrogenase
MENLREAVHCVKEASIELASCSEEKRNNALAAIREALLAHKEEIFQKNREDLEAADRNGIADAVKKRLKFDEGKLRASAEGLESLIGLKDPIGKTQFVRELDEDLILTRVTCPIGVIGVIFEARPDALIQISALCLKSGNAAVLKGGKETASTNKILFTLIREAAEKAGLPASCLLQAESHSEIDELLKCEKDVDLLIPRGSNAFVRYIMENTKIPVMGHADGVCHLYVDETADREKALKIILDAKTQYTAACNAVETILVHRKIAADFLPELAKAMKEAGVKLRGTKEAAALLDSAETMEEDEFSTEYLSLTASVKLVDGVEEAVSHINRFGSHHTDGIVTEDDAAWAYFCQRVDSAGVYKNVSTRFADGFRYGFGAEVGISTGKIHARGPVGLEGLVTYKYLLEGKGQIVADYAEGRKQFHFRDLEG